MVTDAHAMVQGVWNWTTVLFDKGVEENIFFLVKPTLKVIYILYVDGTFRCFPFPFYQLFCLHTGITCESETVGLGHYCKLCLRLGNTFAVPLSGATVLVGRKEF